MKERKLGLLGKKLGMTSIFDDRGQQHGVTVLSLGPCVVLGKRTVGRDGYNALVLGLEPLAAKRVNKPLAGTLAKVGGTRMARRHVLEMCVSEATLGKFDLGAEVSLADLDLKPGDLVDVCGTSKGKGFAGVMKRHHFGGFRASHGTHEYFRHGGSIGCRKWPGRVYKRRKMPGRMGRVRVTTQNLRVIQVRAAQNVLLLAGSIPGAKNGFVTVRLAIKRHPAP